MTDDQDDSCPDLFRVVAGVPRSGKWAKVRADFLAKNPTCAACGTNKNLNVHHVIPYHLDPSLELTASNLMTLCESPSHNCHLLFGHALDWSAFVPDVRVNATIVLKAIRTKRFSLTERGPNE